MVPPKSAGTVTYIAPAGDYTIEVSNLWDIIVYMCVRCVWWNVHCRLQNQVANCVNVEARLCVVVPV